MQKSEKKMNFQIFLLVFTKWNDENDIKKEDVQVLQKVLQEKKFKSVVNLHKNKPRQNLS